MVYRYDNEKNYGFSVRCLEGNPLLAVAGVDQIVDEGTIVTLDGSHSTGGKPDVLTFKWTAPSGIILNSDTLPNPSFKAPEVTQDTPLTFTLKVNDGTVDSPVDTVVITVKQVNKAPVANAGANQTVNEGALVTLDGSASTDADGDDLLYKWSSPSTITLSSANAQKPTFTAPEVRNDSTLSFSLVVNDGWVDSQPSVVSITVKNVANVGVEDLSESGIKVYPNPTSGELTLEFGEYAHEPFEIKLLNANGQVAEKWKCKGNRSLKLDINHLVDGVYFLFLQNTVKTYRTRIILVANKK
jgi:hypothetical protein